MEVGEVLTRLLLCVMLPGGLCLAGRTDCADPPFPLADPAADSLRTLLCEADARYADNIYPAAFAAYKQALAHMQRMPAGQAAMEEYAHVYLRLGKTCYYTGRYDEGIRYVYELLEKHPLSREQQAEAHLLLGNLYLRLQKDNTALRHLDKVREYVAPPAGEGMPGDTLRAGMYGELYLCCSSVYLQKGDYAQARSCLEAAREHCGADGLLLGRIYQNEALLCLIAGDVEGAEAYYRKALVLVEEPYTQAVLRNNLAVCYLQRNQPAEALRLLADNEREATAIDASHVLGNTYYIYAQAFAQTGDYRRAYEYDVKCREVADSLFDTESEERILQQNIRYETLRLENEKKLAEYRLRVAELEGFKKNTLIAFLVLAVGVAVALIVLVAKKAARQKQSNRQLAKQLRTIGQEKDDMLRVSREQYEAELSNKTRKLAANIMYTAEMREAVQRIAKDVEKLEPLCPPGGDATALLDDIRTHMRPLTTGDCGWDDFDLYFGETHPAFFSELYKAFPNLTPMENRLCAFIVLNLSTKEIASLTNRSVRTVESMKFRLRKKMGIPRNVSILSFLQRFNAVSGHMQ